MSKILEPNDHASPSQEDYPAGIITISFYADGKIGWRADGDFAPALAVNMLECIKTSFVQRQLNAAMQAQLQQMKKSVCLPDGSVPLH